MKVELIDKMGSDLSVVNAARVSFAKQHLEFQDNDVGLIRYLANNNEWSPFAHPQLSFRISANIAVARQLWKSAVGLQPTTDILAWNEVSRRYVDADPVFDLPDVWRSRPKKGQSKQGSGEPISEHLQEFANSHVRPLINDAKFVYKVLINEGVAPEQARMILPMATITEWIWTGSLMAFIRVCKERLALNAQQETQALAQEILGHLKDQFPVSVSAWGLE